MKNNKKKDNKGYLADILECIDKVETYISGYSFNEFMDDKNELLRDAVLRNIEVVGEAANRLSNDFALKHPDFPIRKAKDMRNAVLHEYDAVDYDVLWLTVTKDLPNLRILVKEALKTL